MRLPAALIPWLSAAWLASACATSHAVLVGAKGAALSPAEVRIYLAPPAAAYRQIANVSATSRGSFALGTAAKIDKVIERLRAEAARVGANGLLLHGVGGEASGAFGGELSTDAGRSPYVSGVGGSVFLHAEAGDGVAIYVEDH